MSMPKISVIIPAHNRAWSLERAVRSVFAQSFSDWELWLVDDASTDTTPELASRLAVEDDRVRVLRSPTNEGVSRARMRGVAAAAGEWLAFLDSDDEWLPKKLERQVRLAADYQWIHANEIWMRDGQVVRQQAKHRKSGGRIFSRCVEICCVSPSATLVRRDTFERVGGFRADFTVCEDYDLWLRLAVEHEAGFIEEPMIVKHGHDDQLSMRYPAMDFFRVKALVEFLRDPRLTPAERLAVRTSAESRCEILLKGYAKHGGDLAAQVEKWLALTRAP